VAFTVPLFPGRTFESMKEYYEFMKLRDRHRKNLEEGGYEVEVTNIVKKESEDYQKALYPTPKEMGSTTL